MPTASIPAPTSSTRPSSASLDLRGEPVAEHLRAVAAAGLGGVVLSGTVDGMAAASEPSCSALSGSRLAPGGTLVVHSVTRAAWDAPDAPPEADLAPGRPLRPEAWCRLLEEGGYEATARSGPSGADYLVTAVRAGLATPDAPRRR